MKIGSVNVMGVQDVQPVKVPDKSAAQQPLAPASAKVEVNSEVDLKGESQDGSDDKSKDVNEDLLKKSVEQANKTLQQYDRTIEREVHAVTHTVMYKIRDTKTHEVIAEFPPKKIQDMIAKMWELAGLFVDEKA